MKKRYSEFLDLLFQLKKGKKNFKVSGNEIEAYINALSKEDFIEIVKEIGTIPEIIEASSTEEKLYSKASDIVLARCFSEIGLKAKAVSERGNSADIIAESEHGYTLVADAKTFRLSRTAKNQKDFKISTLSKWRGMEHDFAILVAPYFQYPNTNSQIYSSSLSDKVCLLSWEHMLFLLNMQVVEDVSLSLEQIWNAPTRIERDSKIAFADRMNCLFPYINKMVCDRISATLDDFEIQLNKCKSYILERSNDEIAILKTEIQNIDSESVHLILSDIPYGISLDTWDILHNNTNSSLLGTSPAQKKSSVFKKRGKPLNGWSEADKNMPIEYYNWCSTWAEEWLRVLKPGASCFVFAGRRFSHRCICAMEDAGFIFKDMIAWEKDAAAHRAQNVKVVFERRGDNENATKWEGWKLGNLRPLFEPILWFMKPYPIGGTLTDNIRLHSVGGYNEEYFKNNPLNNSGIEVCSNIIKCKTSQDDRGLHPAQKPVALMEFLINLTTVEGQVILDPFCGCGSTLVAAQNLNREYIGIELNPEYCKIISERLEEKTKA